MKPLIKDRAGLPIRILIVDDDQICGEILQNAIEAEGIEAVLASEGMEALEKLSAEPFDILISDLNMPHMDGLTLLRHARRKYPHILTIIITGFGSLQSAIEAIRLGAYDYVQKPFKIEEIMVAARNAIEKIETLREKISLLHEIEVLHQKLQLLQTVKGMREGGDKSAPAEVLSDRDYFMFPRHTLPLCFLEAPQGSPARVLTALESLEELRREGVLDDVEFKRLKKLIIDRMESGRP